MKKKTSSKPRKMAPSHFPYKHPTFGTDSKPKPESYWRDTVYYCWWSFLKRNEEYLKICERGGKGAKGGMKKVYEDFGDVRGEDFKAWWTFKIDGVDRGAHLFAERDASALRVVTLEEASSLEASTLLVSLPLNLPVKYLLERFKVLVDKHHQGERGYQYAKQSTAAYRFRGQPNIRGLLTALMVYDYLKANPKSRQWEVGRILSQFQMELAECDRKGVEPDFLLKRNIEATVNRQKRKAVEYIANVGQGNFLRPS